MINPSSVKRLEGRAKNELYLRRDSAAAKFHRDWKRRDK